MISTRTQCARDICERAVVVSGRRQKEKKSPVLEKPPQRPLTGRNRVEKLERVEPAQAPPEPAVFISSDATERALLLSINKYVAVPYDGFIIVAKIKIRFIQFVAALLARYDYRES